MTRAPRKTENAPRFETQDAPPRGVVFALIGVFALIALTAGLMFAMYAGISVTHRQAPATPLERAAEVPPNPRLQAYPKRDLAAVRTEAEARLSGYGWVDKKAGLVHVPIERAMELEAQRGWTGASSGAAQ